MRRLVLTGATILACMSAVAMAQTTPSTPPKETGAPATTPTNAASTENAAPNPDAAATQKAADTAVKNGASIRQQLTANLQKAGFTDVTVAPESFIVQAKDKSGEPVTMFLDANSITLFTSADAGGDAVQNPPAVTGQSAATSSDAGGMFTNIPAKDDLSSQIVGLNIYNSEKQNISAIKDIAFSRNGVKAYIVGVGGFLGMGDHYVAVRPSAIKVSYDPGEKKWHAEMDTNAAELKAAPEYKYSS
jgi:hypothetical protein